MILTVEELRKHVPTDKTDDALTLWLEAVEQMIRGYTHNNFRKYMVDGVIIYPADVRMGVIHLFKWDEDRRDKVGVASESISRHSVTYVSTPDADFAMCYPKRMLGFLKPYICARFGQGLSV